MPEHRIRLRGGWEISPLPDSGHEPGRLTLPTRWPAEAQGSVRLSRRFGRPPVANLEGPIELEWLDVPGLRTARLNGVPLEPPTAGESRRSVWLDERNVLEMDVDLTGLAGAVEAWGSIALVIPQGAT